MTYSQITVYFRGQNITAQVHKHDTFYLVGFTSIEVIQDFGGLLEFDSDYKVVPGKKEGRDSKDLYRVISDALRMSVP